MSALRDIRLLVARRLDEPPSIKSAVLNVLNILDIVLDAEGFQNTPEIGNALRQLEFAILDMTMEALEEEATTEDVVDLEDLWADMTSDDEEEEDE